MMLSIWLLAAVLVPIVSSSLCIGILTSEHPDQEQCLKILHALGAWQLCVGTCWCLSYRAQVVAPIVRLTARLFQAGEDARLQPGRGMAGLVQVADEVIRCKSELVQREKLIADAASQLVLSFDTELCVVTTNLSAERMLGYLRQELAGMAVTDLVLPEDVARTQAMIAQARAEKNPVVFDNRLVRKDRHALDLRWTVEWSETEQCFFALAEDISIEMTLARSRQEFVAMIGHDIKVPLTSVLLAVQSVQIGTYGSLPENCAATLERTENSVRRLISLINELLDFEKMESGKIQLHKNLVSVSSLIEAAAADVADLAGSKNINVQLSIPETLRVEVDADKLARVLVNLLSNAIKFSPPGSLVCAVALDKDAYVEVQVKDQGPGIAAAYQELIFDKYERVPSAAAVEGTGLGLAIAKAIVESHGGIIGVQSEPGAGCTFWFRIPAT